MAVIVMKMDQQKTIMPVNFDIVAYALTLTVGAMLILFVCAVTCVAISIYLNEKFGEYDDG